MKEKEKAKAAPKKNAAAGREEAAGKRTEEEIERNYTPEEREFVESFLAEYEKPEEPKADEDELAVYSNDYKMYAEDGPETHDIEWDAAMGKVDFWNLPPFEDFDPKVS